MEAQEILSILSDVTVCCGTYISTPDIPNTKKHLGGVVKYCYSFNNEDFVIKFPQDLSKEPDCMKEVEFYQKAITARVDKVVPHTVFLGKNCHGVPFFKQQKIDFSIGDAPYSKLIKYELMTHRINDNLIRRIRESITVDDRGIESTWLKMVWLLYGEKFTRALERWLNENHINDLHVHNIGYLKDKPIIMDFCGYHRW